MRMDRETREITRDRKRNPRPNKHQLLRRCKRDREIGTVRVSLATQYARRFLRVRPPAAREFRRFESGEEKWRDPDVSRRDRLETRRTGIFALGEQRSAALSQTRFKSGSPKAHRFFPPRFAVPRRSTSLFARSPSRTQGAPRGLPLSFLQAQTQVPENGRSRARERNRGAVPVSET